MYEVVAGTWDQIEGEYGCLEQVPNVKFSTSVETLQHAIDLYTINASYPWCCIVDKGGKTIKGWNALE